MNYTQSALQNLCARTNNNPSSINDEIWEKFKDKWRKMRKENILYAIECQNCIFAFEKFEDKYDITLTEDQKKYILENMSTCMKQSEFECLANKALFFKRPDIEQIIADNAVLDPLLGLGCNKKFGTK